MVPSHRSIDLQQVRLLIVDVDTKHLRGVQTCVSTSETATAAEATVARIVSVSKGPDGYFVIIVHAHEACRIAIVRTYGDIVVGHEAFVHATLHRKVKCGLLVAIVDAGDTAEIALLIIDLDTFNDARGQVLECGLSVAGHEFLAADLHLFHFFTIDGNLTIVVNLGTRDAFHQFFCHRTLRNAVSRRVIDKGVFLQNHLLSQSRHLGTLQHNGITLHRDGTHFQIMVVGHIQILYLSDIANA